MIINQNNNNLENHNISTKLTDEEMKNEISKLENNLILILKSKQVKNITIIKTSKKIFLFKNRYT